MDLGSEVALFNVNYRRPYWVVTLAEASLLSRSAAPLAGGRGRWLPPATPTGLTVTTNIENDDRQYNVVVDRRISRLPQQQMT